MMRQQIFEDALKEIEQIATAGANAAKRSGVLIIINPARGPEKAAEAAIALAAAMGLIQRIAKEALKRDD